MDRSDHLSGDEHAAQQLAAAEEHARAYWDLVGRAQRTSRGTDAERDTLRRLTQDSRLARFKLFHDIAWPGTTDANIDHLVVGPNGVTVLDDEYLSHKVTIGQQGEMWTGRHNQERKLAKVRAQADAASRVLEVPVAAVLVVHAAALPEPVFCQSGVTVVAAEHVAHAVLMQTGRLLPGEVATVSERVVASMPQRTGRVPTPAVPSPTSPATAPPTPDATPSNRRRSRTATARPPARSSRTTSRSRRRGRNDLWQGLVGVALVISAMAVISRAASDDPEQGAPVVPPVVGQGGVTRAHSCPAPGSGWTETLTWPAFPTAPVVAWSPAGSEQWGAVPAEPTSLTRTGLPPGMRSVYRFSYREADGRSAEAFATADVPTQPC